MRRFTRRFKAKCFPRPRGRVATVITRADGLKVSFFSSYADPRYHPLGLDRYYYLDADSFKEPLQLEPNAKFIDVLQIINDL